MLTLSTMSEISKSLSGSGIFLLACTVFSSPGRRAVRATCTTHNTWVKNRFLSFQFCLFLTIFLKWQRSWKQYRYQITQRHPFTHFIDSKTLKLNGNIGTIKQTYETFKTPLLMIFFNFIRTIFTTSARIRIRVINLDP